MSFSELPYLRSPSTLRTARRRQHARPARIDAERVVLLWSPPQDASRQNLPAALRQSAWRAFISFASAAFLSFSDILFAVLCWITAHFLAGCANYAQAMSFVPVTVDEAADVAEPGKPAQSAAAARERTSQPGPTLQMVSAQETTDSEIESAARGAP